MSILESTTRCWTVKILYNIGDKFIYEVFDDYKDAKDDELKNKIISMFCQKIWNVNNDVENLERVIRYRVSNKFTCNVSDVFRKYQNIKYISNKSFSQGGDSWTILRQKINNIYTDMCDKDVCKKKDYMDCLYSPKRLYFRFVKGKSFNSVELENYIGQQMELAKELHNKYAKHKMDIGWDEYKNLINGYIKKIFNNYIPLDEFEDKSILSVSVTYWSEDNYVIKYIGKSLCGYMKNYEKQYHGVSRSVNASYIRCVSCGRMAEQKSNAQKYCSECSSGAQYYRPIIDKVIICEDCGVEFEVNSKATKSVRCDGCQEKANKERYIKYNKKRK